MNKLLFNGINFLSMKTLYEGLLDDMEDVLANTANDFKKVEAERLEAEKKEIFKFLHKTLVIPSYVLVKCSIRHSKKNGWVVNYSGKDFVEIYNKNITSLTNGKFKWGKVKYGFDCSDCVNLKTLEGAPESAHSFECSGCTSLENLIGCPTTLGYKLDCAGCTNLKSLEGAPEKLDIGFGIPTRTAGAVLNISNCLSLKSLKYAPKFENGSVFADNTGTEFTPEEIIKATGVKDGRIETGGKYYYAQNYQ